MSISIFPLKGLLFNCALCGILLFTATVPVKVYAQNTSSGEGSEASRASQRTAEELKKLAERVETANPRLPKEIIDAIQKIPRRPFLPEEYRSLSYEKTGIPGEGESFYPSVDTTARCIQLLNLQKWKKVLLIGINTGYASALISQLAQQVYVIEQSEQSKSLGQTAFEEIGINSIFLSTTFDINSWSDQAPFDSIFFHGSAEQIPPDLLSQLTLGGSLLISLRDSEYIQFLIIATRTADSFSIRVAGSDLLPAIILSD